MQSGWKADPSFLCHLLACIFCTLQTWLSGANRTGNNQKKWKRKKRQSMDVETEGRRVRRERDSVTAVGSRSQAWRRGRHNKKPKSKALKRDERSSDRFEKRVNARSPVTVRLNFYEGRSVSAGGKRDLQKSCRARFSLIQRTDVKDGPAKTKGRDEVVQRACNRSSSRCH